MAAAHVVGQTNISFNSTNGFKVIPLGVKGGLDESNLSAYLVAAGGSDQFICLDAGTIYAGLQKTANLNYFTPLTDPTEIQKKYINSYFISHGHLDHTAGLVINSPGDSFKKNIYAIPSVIDVLKSNSNLIFGSRPRHSPGPVITDSQKCRMSSGQSAIIIVSSLLFHR